MKRRRKLPPGSPQVENFALPAHAWNRLIEFVAKWRPLIIQGQKRPTVWHPWKVSAQWTDDTAVARIAPGFVNGIPARFRDPAGDLVELIEPQSIEIPRWRIATDVPAWFSDRWTIRTSTGPEIVTDALGASELIDPDAVQFGPRRLYAADLLLSIGRPRTTIELEPSTGEFRAVLSGAVSSYATISAGEWQEREVPTTLEQITGGLQDSGRDFKLIATVYAIGAEYYDEPQPAQGDALVIKQELFWNLNYAVRAPEFPPGQTVEQLGNLFPWARDLINGLVLDNTLRQTLTAQLADDVMTRGKFWTA